MFAWLGTLWKGNLRLSTPMLFCLGGLFNFIFAGITGVMLATVPIDVRGDTYFVVAHFHYVIFNTIGFGVFAGIYHWFPKFTGRMYYEGLGKVHFASAPPSIWGCRAGSPPRIRHLECDRQHRCLHARRRLDPFHSQHGELLGGLRLNPWRAIGLEWLLPSPPPAENFEDDIPTVISEPSAWATPSDEEFYVRRSQEA